MNSRGIVLLAAAALALLLLSQSVFIVHQAQTALIIQLGQPTGEVYKAGLHFKLPFIQRIVYFDARILDYDARPAEALTSDKKTIVLDNYARWRIADPLLFYRSLRDVGAAQSRLDTVVYSQLRAQVGAHTLTEVVSSQRPQIMAMVTEQTSARMKDFGVQVVDVRIKRTDLPADNQRAIFGRMRAERERQAKQYRSEGTEQASIIRSGADRERTIMLADAQKQGEILRGEGDAEAAATFAAAFSKSPEFFELHRGLEAMRKSLQGNTRMVITSDNPLLKPLQ